MKKRTKKEKYEVKSDLLISLDLRKWDFKERPSLIIKKT